MRKKDGSFFLVPVAAAETELKSSSARILMILCKHQNKEGRVCISQKQIAERYGISLRSVIRGIEELIEKNLIEKKRNGSKKNLYHIKYDAETGQATDKPEKEKQDETYIERLNRQEKEQKIKNEWKELETRKEWYRDLKEEEGQKAAEEYLLKMQKKYPIRQPEVKESEEYRQLYSFHQSQN